MQHTFSVSFGLDSGRIITFWSTYTQVRLASTEKWSGLDYYDFEAAVAQMEVYQFKTTAVWEQREEGDEDEPWKHTDDEEDAIKERPCTWTIRMDRVTWVRTIYLTREEIKALVPH